MTKDEALRLALEALEPIPYKDDWTVAKETNKAITAIKEALAESEPNYKKALEVWLDKTEWVQETVKPHELGMHRADVLKQRIEEASPQRTWVGLMRGVRVEGNAVVITVKGGNDEARALCGELINEMEKNT